MDTPPMESRGWRKVIIQWIRQCEFMDQNYITLEQSDIKAFFVIYMRKARAATAEQEKKQMLQAQPKKSRSLKTFIEENYPEFSVHLDSHGDVASADYLLVYTLLLHCSCVRNRILYFHNICKSLPTPMQAVIAAFFERAVDRELTRQYLRLTITKVSAIYKSGVQNSPCSPQSPDLNCDATPSSSSSIPASPQEPSSTPQSRYRELGSLNDSACEMPAPPTPKGELLDQRTRELRNIQAELEMVRYEKMMLEEQHIDKDKTIKALEKENMEARTELTKLKDAVNSAEEDDDITNGTPNTFEHLKRSLLKEISEKDTAILEINDKLQEAYSENEDLSRKLQECKKTVLMYTEGVRGLEARVKDLNRDIAVRENRIASLERDKQEINQCLQEARDELHSRREVLNASSDLLDCSLSPNTTPENLASSVIDKQLREKEHENAELKEVLLKQSDSLHELNNGLASFLQKHNLNQNLSSDNQTSSFDDLLQKCQTLAQTLESQKEQLGEAMTKNNELEEGAAKARKEINNLRDEFKLKISENELKIDSLEMEKSKLSETCNKLQSLVSEGNEHLDGIKQQLAEKEKQLKDLHTEILDLRDKNESLEGRFRIIEEERRREASEHQHQQEYIKSQHALCRSQLEDRIVDMNQMLSQLNQSDWKSTVERVIEIQAQNEDLKLELSQKMEDLRELHKLNESSQKELENQIQLTAKTDAELAEKTVQLSNSKQEIESFLSRINSLLKSERSSESEEVNQFEEVESLIQLQIQTVDTVELRINIILERLGNLQERNASLQLTVNELRILMGENNAQNETHSKLVGELEKTLEEERLNLKEVSENLSKAEKQIDGNNLEAIKMIATIESRLPKEEGSICTELNNPEQLFHWMNNFVKIYDQMNASRQTLENQNQELNESFEKLKQIKGSLEQKLNDLQDDGSDDQKVKHLIEDNLKLHKVQTEMSETIINITKEMHSRGSRIAEMENTDKQKSAKLDELTEELKARDDEIAMLKDTNQEQMNVLNDSCNQHHKDDDEKANGTANKVEEMLKKLDEEHKELLKTIEDKYEKRCQDLEKSCQDLEKCRNDMEKKLAEKEEEQLVLKNLKAECKQRCQDLEKQLSQIEFQLSEKEFDKDHENEIKTIREQLEDYRLQDQQHRQTIANHNLLLKECESDLKDARLNEQQLRQTIETHKQLLNDMGSNEEELRLRHELENEQKLRDHLKVELAKKEEELRSIMTETKTPTVDVVSDELLDLQTKLQNEQTLTDQLQKQLVQHQEALIKANEEVLITDELTLTKEQQKEIINVREQLIQLQEFYDSSKNEILSLQNKLLNEQKLTDELKLELTNQQEETRKAKEQLVSYESSSAKLQEFNDSSKNELLSLQNKLLNEQKLTDELKLELANQQEETRKAKEQLVSYESSSTKLQEFNDSSKNELLSLQNKLLNEQKLTDELKLELTNQQEENKKAKEQLVSYESSSAKLQELHNSSKKELLSLETKILDEQKHSDELKLELEKQQEETKKAKEQLVSYESLSSTLKEFSESSRNELLNLQTKLLNKQKLTDDLKLKLENQQEETRKTKEQLVSYENRMAELQKLNDSSKIEILSLQTKVQDEQDLINDLKLKLESQQEDLKKANEQLVSYVNLKSEVDGLKVALNSKISDIERLKKEHHKELSELDGLRTKLLDERRLASQFKVEQQEKLDNVTAQLAIRTSQLADAQARWEEEKQQAAKERESNLKEINRLESNNKNSEIQIEKLESELTKAETSHDELHLEVGSANLEARLLKQQLEKSSKMVTDLQNRLETERSEAKENYESVSNRLIEVEEQSKQNLLSALTERNKAQEQVTKLTSRLAKSKKEQREMVLKNDAYRAESSQRLSSYKERLESMEAELAECQQELAVARNANESQAETDLGATYSRGDGGTQSEQQNEVSRQQEARIQKLELDCQILQAKYIESRNEKDRSEQQIKDQRLEMEGKLDKMKDKMRVLYTTEVTRMKERQERDAAKSEAEREALQAQNAKFEEHVRKLSSQIVRLNEIILEHKKQNAIMSTQLKHLQPSSEPKSSTATIIVPSSSSSATNEDWQPFKRPNAPSSNLAMEDEEGEVFNNTYLTDLKLGRVPTEMTAEELMYRNSLQPPHLKSAYAAQYDLGSQDEDLKDGPHSLDDSMSALLSSSSTGARKKSMGTHYKRPGPPTPSKNGGRLSFGNSEPPREILREFGDHNNTSKTPARFRFLTQRFSVGSSGLPRDELPRSTRPNLITGMQRRRLRRAVGLFCTSTPRKSRSYYDQQRMINARNTNSSKTEDEQLEDVEQLEVAEQLEEQEQLEDKADLQEEADQQGTPHLTNEALLALTKGNTRRLTGQAKLRKGRVSLCLHGNIFAKSRPAAACLKLKMSGSAVVAKREKQSRKLRQERMGRFDLARHLDQMYLSNATPSPESAENNNYSLHNRNEDPLPNQLLMGKTMVLKGRSPRTPAGAATFRVEKHCDSLQLQQQFELENMATFSMEGGQSAFEETQEDWQFEELCKKTESSAPFKLRLLDYKPAEEPAEPKLPPLVASCSNITTTSCATNITSASSRKSCTVYSMGSVHMQPMPHVDITYVQPTERILQKPMLNRSLLARCRLLIRRLTSSERLIVGFLLLTIVWMCSILADRMVLALTGVLAGMGLILLITS